MQGKRLAGCVAQGCFTLNNLCFGCPVNQQETPALPHSMVMQLDVHSVHNTVQV